MGHRGSPGFCLESKLSLVCWVLGFFKSQNQSLTTSCVCGCALHVQLLVFSPEQRAAQPFGPAMDPAAYRLVAFLGPYIYR